MTLQLAVCSILCHVLLAVRLHESALSLEEDVLTNTRVLNTTRLQSKTSKVLSLPGLDQSNWNSAHYAGFINVDEANGGNIFYWLVEAERDDPTTMPLTIWLNGGPGCTSMLGLFMEIGPFRIGEDLKLTVNPHGWQKSSNILFVDQPVGTGLSSLATKKFPTTGLEVAKHFYKFLIGFMHEHPSYVNRPIYLFGESHAGRWIPQFTSHIKTMNARNDSNIQFNIIGAGIGNGWVHPLIQYDYSSYAHGQGFISAGQKITLQKMFVECSDAIAKGIYKDSSCFSNLDTIMQSIQGSTPLNFYDIRLYGSPTNYPPGKSRIGQFLDQTNVRKAVHAESSTQAFTECNYDVYNALSDEDGVSTLQDVSEMLKDGLSVLFYNGQWDMMCNSYNTEQVLGQLTWPGQSLFQSSSRYTWRIQNQERPAGFVQSGGNLTFVIVENAGHMVPYDVPEAALDMFTRFIEQKSLSDVQQSIASSPFTTSLIDTACDPSVLQRHPDSWSMWLAISLVVGLSSALISGILVAFYMRSPRHRVQRTILVEDEESIDEDDNCNGDDTEWDDEIIEMEELNKDSRQRKTKSAT